MCGAVALSGAAYAASTVIKSPAQAAAEAGAPVPDVLTAVVKRRELKESVILRGTVAATQTVDVVPTAGGEGGGTPVVTRLSAKAGDEVSEGTALVAVSGRPVFVLKGKLPAFRDLKPGANGDDVAQLQDALARLGYGSGSDMAGTFGPGTQSALAKFYSSIGYVPVPVAEDGPEKVAAETKAVSQATHALTQAEKAGSSAAVEQARAQLGAAEAELASAHTQAGPQLPAAEVLYLNGFPARVESVAAAIGDQVK
ncbi:peptidoglycan-binding domain-containing protein [Streptomyces sp. NPDC047515]|uniref:peptidoglycan-binding domain-containing protein n=1 Tax=Streptomyces sp. NPDC047515 TaxID=3155380 RepID=UPI0034098B21